MTREQVNELRKLFQYELLETHISWVLLSDAFVYKIKKPIQYSFLDFSTLAKRKYYCGREVTLNRRLTDDIYLDVQPVKERPGKIFIGGDEGALLDYAVRMRRMNSDTQMDVLLSKNKVQHSDVRKLAEKIAFFHKKADIIYEKDILDVQKKFNDLGEERD